MTRLDVIVRNTSDAINILYLWHLEDQNAENKLFVSKEGEDLPRLQWQVVMMHWRYFLISKQYSIFSEKTLWFWSSKLFTEHLWIFSGFATYVEVLIDALPQDFFCRGASETHWLDVRLCMCVCIFILWFPFKLFIRLHTTALQYICEGAVKCYVQCSPLSILPFLK